MYFVRYFLFKIAYVRQKINLVQLLSIPGICACFICELVDNSFIMFSIKLYTITTI